MPSGHMQTDRDKWMHVYTDDSSKCNGFSDAEFYCVNHFDGSSIGLHASSFETEIEVIN